MQQRFSSAFLTLAILCMRGSSAQADFLFEDFSSVGGLQLNGDAARVGNVLRLSGHDSYSSGSTFTTDQVNLGLGNSFSTFFQFRIGASGGVGDQDGPGADGLVFVVQTVSNRVGAAGGGIGYSGIRPSLGIEFDTYYNGPAFGDPNGNHVGIDLDGNIASLQTRIEAERFNSGEIWNAWIDYDADASRLEVRWSLSSMRPGSSLLSMTLDLASLLGQDTAFVGFTSATGSGLGNHDLLRWEFRDEFAPVGVPEPAGFVMLGIGTLVFMTCRHRTSCRRVRPRLEQTTKQNNNTRLDF